MIFRTPFTVAVFLMCLLPADSEAQSRRIEDMPDMSLDALFAWGAEPTGDAYMRGMPWPASELLKRDRGVVTTEALRRLATGGNGEFNDAFNVYLLGRLAPPDIRQQLTALYPGLDEKGRYEVLLYALDRPDPLFHPLFSAILERAAQSRSWTREATLSAAFALQVYDPGLHLALENLSGQLDQLQVSGGDILDGFPYSDVVAMSISDSLDVLREALAFNRGYAAMLDRPMTTEEQALLDSYRARLGSVQSLPVSVEPGSLAKLLQQLSARYDWLNFSHISRAVRFSDIQLQLAEQTRSYAEVMAALCNNEPVDVYSDSLVPFNWQVVSNEESIDYVVAQRCVASEGYLFRVIPNVFETAGKAQLMLMFAAYGAVDWLSMNADVEFRFESVEVDGVTYPLETNAAVQTKRFIQLELEHTRLEELGTLKIKGTAMLVIPTSMRIREVDVRDQDAVELTDGPVFLRYSKTAGEVRYAWGLKETGCCSFVASNRHLPLAIGIVQLYDTADVLQRDIALSAANSGQRMELGFSLLNLAQDHVFQPGKLLWIYAPTVEKLEIPFEFEQVRFTPKPQAPP